MVELDSMAGGRTKKGGRETDREREIERDRERDSNGGWGPPIYTHGVWPQVQGKGSEDRQLLEEVGTSTISEEGIRAPGTGAYRWLFATIWVLGTKPESSARIVSALKH